MGDGPTGRGHTGRRHTERLRLEPIDAGLADELWTLHQDPGVAAWWEGAWSRERAHAMAGSFGRSWQRDGVGKWLAYDRATGALVGRGGASITTDLGGSHRSSHDAPDRGRGGRLAPDQDVEIGWAVRGELWGQGYATEIGRAALALVDEVLGVDEVVAYTEVHNRRSRAVMERLGMAYRGEHRQRGLVEGTAEIVDDALFAVYALPRPSVTALRDHSG